MVNKGKNEEPTIEETYQKMDQHEHVLALPDTYIGSIEKDEHKMWVLNEETNRIEYKTIQFVPGLYKIFDEIVTNARDHSVRDKTCNIIKININKDTGEISCWNNGKNGIPVEIHKEYNMYVPEMIFGHLMTSGNYRQIGKIVGGKNGFGAKLTNIYSTYFYVEIGDGKRKLKFSQKYSQNMYKKEEPVITKLKDTECYTLIKFIPDFNKFKLDKLTDDHIVLFKKRVYDICACTNNTVKVYLNDELLKINSFKDYIKLFYDDENMPQHVYEEINDRWKICAIYDPNTGYRHISYVNGICTFQGGTHVNHVVEQVVNNLAEHIRNKNKKLNIKNIHIRDNLTFFIDSVIEDPSFNSQIKECLTNKVTSFGSRCDISETFIKNLSKTGIVDEVVNFAKLKAMAELKKTDGKKKVSLKGLAKLDDAHWAGTRKSKYCSLILTEGDSAKTFAISGIEIVGKEKFGVFPLKGKLLNVREASAEQLANNEEIKNIKQIMGLKHNKKYTNVNELRYGRIIILTDQDVDGSHIKGLLINFIHYFWPSLIKLNGFITSMKTPIIKTWKLTDTKKTNQQIFYTMTDYINWKNSLGDNLKLWKSKYYKGLGTSTEEEAKESFNQFEQNLIIYLWDKNKDINLIDNNDNESESESKSEKDESDDEIDKSNECYDAITLGFDKKRADERKKWLENYNPNMIIENNINKITYSDFIHKDLIHFSNYDNMRSIPNYIDGLKPSQRKILYASFLRKILKEEIKVAQLSGFVSDRASYHHGEESLNKAIIAMAQNYVGSNNINILTPNGGFGTRRLGGKDASSPRYIYTQLNQLVPYIFRKEDECILEHEYDDGEAVEPIYYTPIIPMILVNGTEGIGTGFSTEIPSFNPKNIINNLKLLLQGKSIEDEKLIPWYKDFKGAIKEVNSTTYQTSGIYEIINENTIIITELPIGLWTENYITYLNTLIPDDIKTKKKTHIIKELINDSGNNTIKITIVFFENELQSLLRSDNLEKILKLNKNISMSNMHLYDENKKIKKYKTPNNILESYFKLRLQIYTKRKEHYSRILENELLLLSWKVKFIEDVISGKIIIFKKNQAVKKSDIILKLEELKYPKLSYSGEKSYNYITSIPLFALTEEELEKLKKEHDEKELEYNTYKNTTIQNIWSKELDEFLIKYNEWLNENSINEKVVKKPTKKIMEKKVTKKITKN